ncbi:sensor histidine kinase [Loigolactobacillus jiayinensis]|uniref:histidine kinase n=1 Tax=Loigolactobacillus jiayinensis TaxID=2486016 RepID=A0ABW1RCW3_9LACO|nr:HAMP domain-containing sensor histidine kinase [Loigolactobacillus jiayinensis]
MRLIYQQMLAFFAVIMTTLLVVGLFFIQFTDKMVYENTWDQLEGYADSLMQQAMTVNKTTNSFTGFQVSMLSNSEAVLSHQKVHFAIFNEKNQMIYPIDNGNGPALARKLNKTDWHKLKQGKRIYRKSDHGSNVLKNQQEMTDVLVPYFYNGDLKAVISVGSLVSNVHANITKIEHNLFIALLISSVAAVILSFLLAKYQILRINRLRGAAHKVAKGDFDVQIDSKHRDELDDLAVDFNQMTTALRESGDEIKRQEERRRQFMADAAHEMRTPLTTINGLLEGLQYDAIPEDMRGKSIELMQNETKRLIRIVNENLDYEKIRTNQISLSKRNFNGTEALQNIVMQLTKKANNANNDLILTPGPSIQVYADYDRFVQVMFNVIQNAIQFTQNGTITITAKHGYHETIFSVQDTGIGMSADQLKNIWERYYKADPSRKNTKYGESGLGLAIVHQLVQLHGGEIKVASKQNQGTTFTISFPDQATSEETASKKKV